MDLYELLGVEAVAGRAELARAYRRRLRELHPDARSPNTSGPHARRDQNRLDPPPDLAVVQHAYQVLRDPTRRARYDAELRARAAGTSGARRPPPDARAGAGRRSDSGGAARRPDCRSGARRPPPAVVVEAVSDVLRERVQQRR